MAPRRRPSESDAAAELKAWRIMFASGRDYLGMLRKLGTVPLDEQGLPSREVAADAWRRLGARFLAKYNYTPSPYNLAPWGLREFGPP
jgi:hypothetical protein